MVPDHERPTLVAAGAPVLLNQQLESEREWVDEQPVLINAVTKPQPLLRRMAPSAKNRVYPLDGSRRRPGRKGPPSSSSFHLRRSRHTSTLDPVLPPPLSPSPNNPLLPTSRLVLHHGWCGLVWFVHYLLTIVRPAISYLRYPLTLFLFLSLLASLLNTIKPTLYTVFSPLCYAPGFSSALACKWVNLARSPASVDGVGVVWADYPGLVEVQGKTFEHLVDDSFRSAVGTLSLDIKKTEIATSDLVTLIRLSDLCSKNLLADALGEFIQDAKNAGKSLRRLESKMNGAIDSIMAVNDFSLHAIDSARTEARARKLWSLAVWSRNTKSIEDTIKETFIDSMHVLSTQLERLIVELEVNYSNLEQLEERLSTLREMVARENKAVAAAREELLGHLWTMLGGNKKGLRGFDRNLNILRDLTGYRKQALAHIVVVLHTLQVADQDLQHMRERVAGPNLSGRTIEPEVHMRSINNGLERFKENRWRVRRIEEKSTMGDGRKNDEAGI
ncbi:hypothetical protein MD484_g8806, partial [Candolleomyces efflorescens]